MIHHNFRKGQPIFIILKDGRKVMGKYLEKHSKGIMLNSKILIKYEDMRSATIWRGERNAGES